MERTSPSQPITTVAHGVPEGSINPFHIGWEKNKIWTPITGWISVGRPHSSGPASQPPPDNFHDHRHDQPLTDEGGRWLPNDEITREPEELTELGREVITVQQLAAGGPPPKVHSTAPVGTLHDPSDPRPWEAWCARQRHEEEVNGWPVTDEEGRWLPNKEWPKTPTSGNWGRRGYFIMVRPSYRKYGTGEDITPCPSVEGAVSVGART